MFNSNSMGPADFAAMTGNDGFGMGYMDHANGLREMYKTADPAMKKQMKTEVAKLLNEMPA